MAHSAIDRSWQCFTCGLRWDILGARSNKNAFAWNSEALCLRLCPPTPIRSWSFTKVLDSPRYQFIPCFELQGKADQVHMCLRSIIAGRNFTKWLIFWGLSQACSEVKSSAILNILNGWLLIKACNFPNLYSSDCSTAFSSPWNGK